MILALFKFSFFQFRKSDESHKLLANFFNNEHQVFKAQMNPHFIFNTFNSIQKLIAEKHEKPALKYLNIFSRFIRGTLEKFDHSRIDLDQEIEILDDFIQLEILRYAHPFDYQINVHPIFLNCKIKIPNLILLPFVENAILNCVSTKTHQSQLMINISPHQKMLQIEISDQNILSEIDQSKFPKLTPREANHEISIILDQSKWYNQKITNQSIEIIDLCTYGIHTGTKVQIRTPFFNSQR